MSYIDYPFYADVYGGLIPQLEFNKLKILATSLVDYYTFNRISDVNEKIKYCMCELIDELARQEKINTQGTGLIKSESVSKYSVTYQMPNEGLSSEKLRTPDEKIYFIIKKWLSGSGLMYRGLM